MVNEEQEGRLLSVVIPVRNESGFIGQTLEQLLAQDMGSYTAEFLIVDGDSEDGTQAIVEKVKADHPDRAMLLLDNPKRLSSAARNIGIRNARGRYVLIIDGHVFLPSANILRRYMELANENHAKVVGRPQRLTPPGLTDLQRIIAAVRASPVGHSIESHIYATTTGFVSPISVAVMYERNFAVELGGFDESFDAAEDLEFNYRLEKMGVECFVSPELEVFYYPRDTILGLFKQMSRYGMGRARFLRKHPGRFTIESVVPASFVLGVVALVLLGFWNVLFFKVLLILGVAYAAIVFFSNRECLRFYRHKGVLVLLVALATHVGLGAGFLKGLLCRGPSGKK